MLYSITSILLKVNVVLLFIVFAIVITIKSDWQIINALLINISWVCFCGWIYAIGQKAKLNLMKQKTVLNAFNYYNWFILIILVLRLLASIFPKASATFDVSTGISSVVLHVFYIAYPSKWLILDLLFIGSWLFAIVAIAKILVSAEKNRNVTFGEYLRTIVLLFFYPVGVWFIQPRVQKL